MKRQEECYKHEWILHEARFAISRNESMVTNTDKLENNIMNRVGKYLSEDKLRIKNRRYIRRLIYQEIKMALLRFRKEESVHFSAIQFENLDGETVEYEPASTLASVESGIELKETIELLAQNDRRRELILNAWANGYTDDREISGTLASTLGGKSESHRKFIQRFKIDCREKLATAI